MGRTPRQGTIVSVLTPVAHSTRGTFSSGDGGEDVRGCEREGVNHGSVSELALTVSETQHPDCTSAERHDLGKRVSLFSPGRPQTHAR